MAGDLLESSPEAMVLVDAEGRIVLANESATAVFLYGHDELIGMEIEALVPARFRAGHRLHRGRFVAEPVRGPMGRADRELLALRRDGSELPIAVRLGPLNIAGKAFVAVTIADTAQRAGVRKDHARLAAVVQSSDDAIVSMTTDGVIQTCNPGVERLLDRSAAWLIGRNIADLMPRGDREVLAEACGRVYASVRGEGQDLQFFRGDGILVSVSANIFGLRDSHDTVIGYAMIARNTSAESEMRRKLERLAHFDQLTGLASRSETLARFKAALRDLRSPGPRIGLLFCDLDNFKSINDTWGHVTGDFVLATVAARIRGCLRKNDIVGRTGGDEILVLLPDIDDLLEATTVAEKIRCGVAEPIYQGKDALIVTLSIGATLAVAGESVAQVTTRADIAMYQSKQTGRNRVTCI